MADIEKVKRGLAYCADGCATACPYTHDCRCGKNLSIDSMTVIEGLQAELAELKDRHETIVKAADDMLAELKERRWIPVSERLPEERHSVLVYCPEYRNIFCAYYYKDKWNFFGDGCKPINEKVTHWMPLPEPPMMD